MFIWKVFLENCGKDCAAAPEIQCCRLFAPTLLQNGRGIELQRNISAILCPFGNLITMSDLDKDADPLMQSPRIQKYIHE